MANLAYPLSASLAGVSDSVDGIAVARQARVSGPLHDLLPAAIAHPGRGRAGTTTPVVDASGRAHADAVSLPARSFLHLQPRLRQRAGWLRRSFKFHT